MQALDGVAKANIRLADGVGSGVQAPRHIGGGAPIPATDLQYNFPADIRLRSRCALKLDVTPVRLV